MDRGAQREVDSDCSVELIYPPSVHEVAGWETNTMPLPITPLEFDLQACSFADGFGQALSSMLGRHIRVAVRSRNGRLDSVMTTAPDMPEEVGQWMHTELRVDWRRRVRPTALRYEQFFSAADAVTPGGVSDVLRATTARMTTVTFQHHTLILPARLAIVEFCEFATAEDITGSELEALTLLAGRSNATTRIATRLWDYRSNKCDLPPLAQEGEGYGLACPGWLESQQVPRLLAELYARCGRSPRELVVQSSRRRGRRWNRIKRTLARKPVAVLERFNELHDRARQAVRLTEDHAPLIHARLPHAMRQLVHRLGSRLVDRGLLAAPEDLLYLRPHEVRNHDRDDDRTQQRRAECAEFDLQPNMATNPTSDNDPLGDGPVARRMRRVFTSSACNGDDGEGRSVGCPASPGAGRGPLRRVERQADLANVEPGDVVLAAGSGAVWSYAAPAASGFIIATGSPFGHLASLARDYALPCVVGVEGLGCVDDGQPVEVDGTTGAIKYDGRKP
ncbi:PEP-utilizing enzyme [Haloechinothrix sp. LS1_15]|uniref:PEP-utilizing enzyme n=1 Tax=Haloechinothrix sp. LS1_15 TaxID=2652248 RepID=UPI002947E5BA|nr:PEP-utilizing enzyme [Haloechinothrix sp. LS1_15]MDV6011204.1 hypothetical protein [Haloechinothrix sp. LS1_15]